MNKKEIILALEHGRVQFLQAIEGLSDEQMQQPGVVGEWSVKDLLAHLSLWEAELITLLWQLKQGQKPSYPTLNNQDVDRLNEQWFRENRTRPLERVLADFLAVRKQTIRQVERYIDSELNDPKRYPALGGEPLEEWIAGDSYRHEAEHEAQLRAWREKITS
jgi:hypothetical protein